MKIEIYDSNKIKRKNNANSNFKLNFYYQSVNGIQDVNFVRIMIMDKETMLKFCIVLQDLRKSEFMEMLLIIVIKLKV